MNDGKKKLQKGFLSEVIIGIANLLPFVLEFGNLFSSFYAAIFTRQSSPAGLLVYFGTEATPLSGGGINLFWIYSYRSIYIERKTVYPFRNNCEEL